MTEKTNRIKSGSPKGIRKKTNQRQLKRKSMEIIPIIKDLLWRHFEESGVQEKLTFRAISPW